MSNHFTFFRKGSTWYVWICRYSLLSKRQLLYFHSAPSNRFSLPVQRFFSFSCHFRPRWCTSSSFCNVRNPKKIPPHLKGFHTRRMTHAPHMLTRATWRTFVIRGKIENSGLKITTDPVFTPSWSKRRKKCDDSGCEIRHRMWWNARKTFTHSDSNPLFDFEQGHNNARQTTTVVFLQ